MSSQKFLFETIAENYCQFIDSCGKFICFTVSKKIQSKKATECEKYIKVIKLYKQQAIKNKIEEHANELFHMQCMINATRSFLLMWIALKENEFNKAWSRLIDAQEYVSIALKIHDYEGVYNLENLLKSAEESIFPSMSYNSLGIIETIGKCSICLDSFSLCNHIENHIYMGCLCQRIDREIIKVDHTALVKNSRDRRCIITKISDDDGIEIDYFTREKTGKK